MRCARLPRLGERRGREIEAGHLCAEAGQRNRVSPDVALKMDALDARELAQPRPVEADHLRKEGGIGDEALDGIVGRSCMRRSPFIPVGPVDVEVVVHPDMMSQAQADNPG